MVTPESFCSSNSYCAAAAETNWPMAGEIVRVGLLLVMVWLPTGETRVGVPTLSVSPSGPWAGAAGFESVLTGLKGVDTPHASETASRHMAPAIQGVFNISTPSRFGTGDAAWPRRSLAT